MSGFSNAADPSVCAFDKTSCPAGTAPETSFCKPCPEQCATCTLDLTTSLFTCITCNNPNLYKVTTDGKC